MRLADTPDGVREATKHAVGVCPSCRAPVIPKCGPIVTWHWAHEAQDCDPWAEPETEWHLGWKRLADRSEVVMRQHDQIHRADIVTAAGVVVELQSQYLDVASIRAREAFYGRMVWLYRVTWADRLHFGTKGFWWKHGSKAMAMTQRPLYWDFDDGTIVRVRIGLVGTRVLGQIARGGARPSFIRWLRGEAAA